MIARLLCTWCFVVTALFAAESQSILVNPGIIDIGMLDSTVDSVFGTAYIYSKNDFSIKIQSQDDVTHTSTEVTLTLHKDGSVEESTLGQYRGYKVLMAVSVKDAAQGKSIRKFITFDSSEFPNEKIGLMLVGFKQ
ncbi:MAG: hypothetical protein OCC49_06895 [Fibrobacterales bacterium]